MTDKEIDIPDCLAKHGITKVEDNVPKGYQVVPPKGVFFMLFGEELRNSKLIRRGPNEDKPETVNEDISWQCLNCVHLLDAGDGPLNCLAFPEGIPEEIITGKTDHSKPYPGDMGFMYTSIEKDT